VSRPLIAVYAVTAAVSIAFSYVSLHTWFPSRERPAKIERALYDELNVAAGKAHGYISRATDQDPYLSRSRGSRSPISGRA
jgi:hypothetical protein